MATLKKYNLAGEALGEVEINQSLAESQVNHQVIKDYIVALRANARQWSANTKGRSEVNHSKKKPRPQKGTGSARQGSLAAPQFKGGGVVFGPKPKFNQKTKMNRKQKIAAIRALVGQKIREGKVIVLDRTEIEAPKTNQVSKFLTSQGIDRKVLFLGESETQTVEVGEEKFVFHVPCFKHENFIKSLRNLPETHFSLVSNTSGYDIAWAGYLVVSEEALKELENWLI